MMDFIPVYTPIKAKNQSKYVMDCIDTNWISSRGEYIKKFEEGISKHLGIKHTIAVCNGTVSLSLIMAAMGIKRGDEVITPSLTYAATVSAIHWSGATPVFVDSDDKYQMSLENIEKSINTKTKAILVPELYGDAPDMIALKEICANFKINLIEDSAEAFDCFLGHNLNRKYMGTFGQASSFSFFANKSITCGEGGCVCTDDTQLAEKLTLLKNQSHIGSFIHSGPGFNFRMTNIAAAIGLAQLEEIEGITYRKKYIADFYIENLSKDIVHIKPSISSAEWMPLFRLPETINFMKFSNDCKTFGIDTRPCFTPVHMMPGFKYRSYVKLKNCEKIYKQAFNLPSFPDLSENQLSYIVETVNKVVSLI